MKRLTLALLLSTALIFTVQVPAQQPAASKTVTPATYTDAPVSIGSDCSPDHPRAGLYVHLRTRVYWISNSDPYLIVFKNPQQSPCYTEDGSDTIPAFVASPNHPSAYCYPQPENRPPATGDFPYEIISLKKPAEPKVCKDPVVVVSDGALRFANNLGEKLVSVQYESVLDDGSCRLLYGSSALSKKNSDALQWRAAKDQDYQITIKTSAKCPCLDNSGKEQCTFHITKGFSDVCTANKSADKDDYTYTVIGEKDTACPAPVTGTITLGD